jgi:putative heme-binding domain-containing protein
LFQPLEARARGYLHANCGHCHSDHGGGSVPLRLQFSTPVDQMKAVGVRPTRGDFSLPDACIIQPGDPYASTLYFRMAKFGRDRMPHIGSELPDEAGLKLIAQWIAGMRETPPESATPATTLADPKSALAMARKIGRSELSRNEQDSLLLAAAKLPIGPVRDLFEGYFREESGPRKLGSNPRPRMILALAGDTRRGEQLFWSQAVNCGKCHRVGERGTPVGPDLSTVGKLRSAEDLLESLLTPSRRIEPKYAAYFAETADGQALTGVLVKRDEKQIVLRDAQGKEVVLATDNVEQLHPSRLSLMPEGQMAGLTPQEAADLLAYLAARK